MPPTVIDGNRWKQLDHISDADVQRGLRFEKGDGVAQSWSDAVKWYRRAAAGGVPAGEWALGDLYWSGRGVARDYPSAARWYAKAARHGFVRAITTLGEAYELGRGVPLNLHTATALFQQAASRGDALGEYFFGAAYALGQGGVKLDYQRSVFWLGKAVAQHDHWAELYLGTLYEFGLGLAKSYQTAQDLYERSAKGGFGDAQRRLAQMYEFGRGVSLDESKADSWYRTAFATYLRAAQLGDPYSQTQLALLYHRGKGTSKDDRRMVYWLEHSIKANDPAAERYLGTASAQGWGVVKDGSKALAIFKRYAAEGHVDGPWFVGLCYEVCASVRNYALARAWYEKGAAMGDGYAVDSLGDLYVEGRGVTRNYALALSYHKKAAALLVPTGARSVGRAYWNGLGVAKDYAQAIAWFEKAISLGDDDAYNYLGLASYDGFGKPQDYRAALGWFEQAASAGNATGQYNVGWMHLKGYGTPKDVPQAIKWFRRAANNLSLIAQDQLGDEYAAGDEALAKNPTIAAQWYEKAADAGLSDAQAKLGRLYAEGTGVAKNPVTATKWLALSVVTNTEGNVPTDSDLLKSVAAGLNSAQKSEASRQITDWARDHGDLDLLSASMRVPAFRELFQNQTPGAPSSSRGSAKVAGGTACRSSAGPAASCGAQIDVDITEYASH